eukprot:scaffold26734_cov143-Skeletonema_menzelii.AAC.4
MMKMCLLQQDYACLRNISSESRQKDSKERHAKTKPLRRTSCKSVKSWRHRRENFPLDKIVCTCLLRQQDGGYNSWDSLLNENGKEFGRNSCRKYLKRLVRGCVEKKNAVKLGDGRTTITTGGSPAIRPDSAPRKNHCHIRDDAVAKQCGVRLPRWFYLGGYDSHHTDVKPTSTINGSIPTQMSIEGTPRIDPFSM